MTIALDANNNVVIGGVSSGKVRLSRVHIKFVVDGTGSSSAFNTGIQAVIKDVVAELPKRVGEAKFGLHVGRDLDCDRDHDVNLGDDLPADDLIKQLELIQYAGGGDELETQINSMLQVGATTAWVVGDGTRRVGVLATSSGSKNAPDGSNAAQAGAKLAAMGVKVVVIAPPDAPNVHDLAYYSGGICLPLSNMPDASELKRLRDLLTKSLTQLATSGAGTIGFGMTPGVGSNGTVMLSNGS